MNDAIANVLSDETYTTNEEKVNAIVSAITGSGKYIPKDKFDNLNNKLKDTESRLNATTQEFDDFKKSKMTDDEKAKEAAKELEDGKKANAIKASELAVKSLLLDNGIKIDDKNEKMKKMLSNIISEDETKSVELANDFIELLKETKEDTKNETVTGLLNGTPKPIVGGSNNNVSNLDDLQSKYDKAVEDKDVVAQATYIRLIQEEQAKQKV